MDSGPNERGERSLETDGGDSGTDTEGTIFGVDTEEDRSRTVDPDERSAGRGPSEGGPSGERSSAERSAGDAATKQPLHAGEVYCSDCGEPIKERAEICPHCGVRQRPPPTPDREKSPALAALASVVWTGAGQIYTGRPAKGVFLMVLVFAVAFFAFGFALLAGGPLFVLVSVVVLPLVWLYSVYDAYRTAERINDHQRDTRP